MSVSQLSWKPYLETTIKPFNSKTVFSSYKFYFWAGGVKRPYYFSTDVDVKILLGSVEVKGFNWYILKCLLKEVISRLNLRFHTD